MRKHYISKPSDKTTVYRDITNSLENANKAIYELTKTIKSHNSKIKKDLINPSIKSGNPDAVIAMVQSIKGFEEALEASTKRFTRKIESDMRRDESYYVIRIKTKTGYVKSEESETKLRAARRLRLNKMQKDAENSFFANSPRVYSTKFAMSTKGLFDKVDFSLDKFLGETDKKLEQVSKIYNNMNFEIAEAKRVLDEDLKKAWEMLMSIRPNKYANFSSSATDLKNLNKLIKGHFAEIVQGLMFVRSNIEANVASANEALSKFSNYGSDSLEFSTN